MGWFQAFKQLSTSYLSQLRRFDILKRPAAPYLAQPSQPAQLSLLDLARPSQLLPNGRSTKLSFDIIFQMFIELIKMIIHTVS